MTDASDKPANLSRDVVAEIRKQAIAEVTKWVIIAFVALIGIAASGWWFYLKEKIDGYIDTRAGLPTAAVVAFDQPGGCPKGWSLLDQALGRVVVGTATAQQASANSVVAHPYRDASGKEVHKLTEAELPQLKFSFSINAAGNAGGDRYEAGGKNYPVVVVAPTPINLATNGKGDAFSTMPPYVALFYCKKD